MPVISQKRQLYQVIHEIRPIFKKIRKDIKNPLLPVVTWEYLAFQPVKPFNQGVT